MKISELNQASRVDEGIADALLGDVPLAALKGMFTGKGTKHQLAQDMFLRDFYQDAITSLDNGIKGGIVNPAAVGPDTASSGVEQNPANVTPAPGEPGAAPAGPGATAAAAKQAQQQTTQTINNYIKGAAKAINSTTDKNQKIALTKELVNAMADRQGSPEWDNAMATVQMIIKRAGTDPNFANKAIQNLKSGKTMSEAWRIYFANLLIESVGLTWKDLGLCVLKESTGYSIADRKYLKLNTIFESIMEADNSLSISEYMTDWFDQYMQGVNWKARQSAVMPLIKNIEATYKTDKGKAAIKKLARAAYALSNKATGLPAGAKNAFQGTKPAAATAPKPSHVPKTAEELQAEAEALRQSNPQEYEKFIKGMSA